MLKKFIFIFLFCSINLLRANEKDSLKTRELMFAVVNLNYFDNQLFLCDRNNYEVLNGILLRFTRKNIAFRFHGVFNSSSNLNQNKKILIDGGETDLNRIKYFSIGVGIQYNFFKAKDIFYSFLDVNYRFLQSSGTFLSYTNSSKDSYSCNSNGLFSSIGAGYKLKLVNTIYLVPELGFSFVESKYKIERQNEVVQVSNSYSYNQFGMNPFFRIFISAKF